MQIAAEPSLFSSEQVSFQGRMTCP